MKLLIGHIEIQSISYVCVVYVLSDRIGNMSICIGRKCEFHKHSQFFFGSVFSAQLS